ncbi:hypothetical protein JD844_003076 [Phrynosoma platyrhinos]|uniref:Tetraspanin-13 n=1 Tax=Phrynosoma platyrhinos TaxID=52577 RepID=A0ABQ7TCR7_PHRPL|nr:hypothetical protein JD844_003076 [Phrynosoma platyrhinos]
MRPTPRKQEPGFLSPLKRVSLAFLPPETLRLAWAKQQQQQQQQQQQKYPMITFSLFTLQLVSLLLIGIAAWGIGFGLISSFRVVGVVVAVGIFLFLIALVGLIGAIKHHQVLLFFYMIILLLVFIIQFSVSCACLTLNKEQQECVQTHTCQPCAPIMKEYSGMVLRFVGGIGLFFSFTEILGVWLTYRYRNQKDPRANPSAFL